MKKQVSISLTDSQRAYLKQLSLENGNSISSTIRSLIDGQMKASNAQKQIANQG